MCFRCDYPLGTALDDIVDYVVESRTEYVDDDDDRLDSDHQFKVTGTKGSKAVDMLVVDFEFDESFTLDQKSIVVNAMSKAAFEAIAFLP